MSTHERLSSMRLLHVVPSYLPATRYGGPIWSVHGLCRTLSMRGHEVHVFTTNVDGPNDSDVPLGAPVDLEGVKVTYFPSKHFRRLFWSPQMARALKQTISHFDMVHNHSIFLWPTWASAQAARHRKIPYVISPRGMLNIHLFRRKSRWIKTIWFNAVERFNFRRAAGIHFTTPIEMREATRFNVKINRPFIIPNAIDIEDARYTSNDLSKSVESVIKRGSFLLFLSRVNWKKGLDRLIPALSFVPDIPLVIAGNDEDNYQLTLEKLADFHGVRNRISFIGPVYGADKTALFKNAQAMVLPSYSENFGMVVIEAMAAGCPVIITPEVGISETISMQNAGIVVEGNAEKIGTSISDLIANPTKANQLRSAGPQIVKKFYSWETVTQKMIAAYEEILRESAHP